MLIYDSMRSSYSGSLDDIEITVFCRKYGCSCVDVRTYLHKLCNGQLTYPLCSTRSASDILTLLTALTCPGLLKPRI